MTWTYNNNPFVPSEAEMQPFVGFVYLITNLTNGRKYIGKKNLWMPKYKMETLKNGNKRRKKYMVPSDYHNYWSSSVELVADVKRIGEQHFTREVLHLAEAPGVLSYLELKEQILREVLETDEYYNGIIQVRVNKSHLTRLPKTQSVHKLFDAPLPVYVGGEIPLVKVPKPRKTVTKRAKK